jgi:hypothetical protein
MKSSLKVNASETTASRADKFSSKFLTSNMASKKEKDKAL